MSEHSLIRRISPKAWRQLALLLFLGLVAGFANGLLGAGGGILLVYAVTLWSKRNPHASTTLQQRDVYANALAVMLPVSLLSVYRYANAGTLSMQAFVPLLLPSLLGGLCGGWLLDRLQLSWIRKLFALLVVISGVFMVLRA